jgi:hypothetical protein
MHSGSASLDPETAARLASALSAIDGFWKVSKEGRERIALQLQKLCTGTDSFTPEEQATLLVDEAISTLEEWKGWRPMLSLFDALFRSPDEYSAVAPACLQCGGSGSHTVPGPPIRYVRCACERGPMLVTDADLERLNSCIGVPESDQIAALSALVASKGRIALPVERLPAPPGVWEKTPLDVLLLEKARLRKLRKEVAATKAKQRRKAGRS